MRHTSTIFPFYLWTLLHFFLFTFHENCSLFVQSYIPFTSCAVHVNTLCIHSERLLLFLGIRYSVFYRIHASTKTWSSKLIHATHTHGTNQVNISRNEYAIGQERAERQPLEQPQRRSVWAKEGKKMLRRNQNYYYTFSREKLILFRMWIKHLWFLGCVKEAECDDTKRLHITHRKKYSLTYASISYSFGTNE